MTSRTPKLAGLAVVLAVGALLPGCLSPSETYARWVEAPFDDISYPSLFGVVVATVGAEGFPVSGVDIGDSRLKSDWAYGTSQRAVRGPSRKRVHVEIERQGDRAFLVRMRVEEEVIRKRGLLATEVRESADWEAYPDDVKVAELVLAKLRAMLGHYGKGAGPAPLGP